jgi:hypothetical protein
MLDGILNFGWKRVENLVNCLQLLFTGTEWHSKFGRSLCKNRWEKHHRAFVKVVEGSEIYSFPIHHLVHFSSKFERKSCLKWPKLKQFRARARSMPRPRAAPPEAARRPRPRLLQDAPHPKTSWSFPVPRAGPQFASDHARRAPRRPSVRSLPLPVSAIKP